MPSQPLTKTAFKKGEKRPCQGRPKGCVNKNTKALKDMILGALDDQPGGGQAYLSEQARENPNAFLSLVGKVLPLQVTGENGGAINIQLVRYADAPVT